MENLLSKLLIAVLVIGIAIALFFTSMQSDMKDRSDAISTNVTGQTTISNAADGGATAND